MAKKSATNANAVIHPVIAAATVAEPIVAIVAPSAHPYDTAEKLKAHLESLNGLKGREIQDAIAATIRELAKLKPVKAVFSSDKATRKAQMQAFKDATKAHKVLTQRVYLYLEERGLGEVTTSYRASVTATGIVSATEATRLKLGGKGDSVSI